MASVVFWRPLSLTSSSQFRKEDRHSVFGLIPADRNFCGGATRPFSKIAGWIPCLGVVPDSDVPKLFLKGPPDVLKACAARA